MQSHLKQTLVEGITQIAELCAGDGTMQEVSGVIQSMPRRDRLARIGRLARTVELASKELSLLAVEEAGQDQDTRSAK